MKDNIHFFSQKENVKKGVDLEKLGMRGRQANEFSELFPADPAGLYHRLRRGVGPERPEDRRQPKSRRRDQAFRQEGPGDSRQGPRRRQESPALQDRRSPNLAVSNYPTLHDFGLARDTVAGFASWVGENFAAHEVLFLVRGMLAVEEKVAELERREKDRVKAVEASERCPRRSSRRRPQRRRTGIDG